VRASAASVAQQPGLLFASLVVIACGEAGALLLMGSKNAAS
jgi:hypothetical protein